MDNQEKQSKEQQILAAAEQEFLTRGYDGARTTSIAQAAGVTHAMLHYYFRTKEQLFKRIVRGLQSEINRSAERGEIERVDIKMLFISIMSLNIFTFLAYSFMEPLMGELMVNRERFLAERKAENIETILRRIKKQ